jgi:hypothetical protein
MSEQKFMKWTLNDNTIKKSWFFKRINRFGQPLATLPKRRSEKTKLEMKK